MNVTKAVIPAAGFGTRFLPATKTSPKDMLPVVDKPVIQYVVEEEAASGLTDILDAPGREGILGGLKLGQNEILWCFTEITTKGNVDRSVQIIKTI